MITGDEGYSIYERVFDIMEMLALQEALADGYVRRTKAGARHILQFPVVQALANDPRLLAIAADFVGPTAVPFRATLLDKSESSNWLVVWHQDTAVPMRRRVESQDWGPWSTKAGVWYAHAPAWALERVVALRVHLDDSTETNGPLRVLPGTHTRGVLTEGEIRELAGELNPICCCAPAGGVVAMRPLTIHASSKSTDPRPRRVVHIEYADSLNPCSGVELAPA